MPANCSDSAILAAVPARNGEDNKISHLLYQSATVLAILLFLLSFWSC